MKPTVLVVDDTAAIRKLVSFTLAGAGFAVVEASSGQEALEIIERTPPDLILLDVMMPELTGIDVVNEIRSRWPDLDLPVIFLSAKSEITDKEAGFGVGAEDYITKPFIARELALRVQAHIKLKSDRDALRNDVQIRERLSATDELTGAYNRRHLMQRMQEELAECLRYGRPLAFLIFDIDHFKEVNDHFGHLAGDNVLRELTTIIQANVRREDVLARYGGEEFGVLLPSTWADMAKYMGERIRQAVAAAEMVVSRGVLHITVSAGISGFPVDRVESVEEIIDLADRRLYVAKSEGRNRVVGPVGDVDLSAA